MTAKPSAAPETKSQAAPTPDATTPESQKASSPEAKATPEKPEGNGEQNPKSTKETAKPEAPEKKDDAKDPAKAEPEKKSDDKGKEGDADDGKTSDDATGEKNEGAPEKYDLVLPENSAFEADDVREFEEAARKNGWSNDEAQGFLNEQAKKLDDKINQRKAAWAAEVAKDPEFAGDKLKEAVGLADKAINQYFGPGIRSLMERTGYGNHPEVIKGFARIGRTLANDTLVRGDAGPKKELSKAERIFGPNEGGKG